MMKRYFVLINLALITVAIYFGVAAYYKYEIGKLAVGPETGINGRPSQTSGPAHTRPLSAYKAIETRNLFDVRVKEPTPTPSPSPPPKKKADVDALQKTDLKLKLFGTIFSVVHGSSNVAIIADNKNQQRLYRVGDSVEDAIVKTILRERVILNVNGKDETLEIEKASGGQKKTIKPPVKKKVKPKPKPLKPPRRTKIKVKRSELEESMNNLNEVFKQVRVRPHFFNGKPDGLTISGIKPKSAFRKLGLKSGDVILGVDGKDIRSVDDALEFYRSLGENANLQLKIKRRGMPRIIDYDIR